MFAGAVREAVLSNPNVIQRINTGFVPVALKAAFIQNSPDNEEGRLYREIGRSKPAPQGICVINSAGKVLDWALMFDDDKSVLAFLDHSARRYAQFPDAQKPVAAERYMKFPSQKLPDVEDSGEILAVPDRHPQGKHCPATPLMQQGTIVARLFGRTLDKDGNLVADTVPQENYVEDRFDVPVVMQETLAKALADAGAQRFRLADNLARLLVSHAYLGQLDVLPISPQGSLGNLKTCELWAKAEHGGSGLVQLHIDGKSEAGGALSDGQDVGDGRFLQHEVKLTWKGIIEMKGNRMPRLLLVARGSERLKSGKINLQLNRKADVTNLPGGHAIDLNCGVRYGIIGEPVADSEAGADEPGLNGANPFGGGGFNPGGRQPGPGGFNPRGPQPGQPGFNPGGPQPGPGGFGPGPGAMAGNPGMMSGLPFTMTSIGDKAILIAEMGPNDKGESGVWMTTYALDGAAFRKVGRGFHPFTNPPRGMPGGPGGQPRQNGNAGQAPHAEASGPSARLGVRSSATPTGWLLGGADMTGGSNEEVRVYKVRPDGTGKVFLTSTFAAAPTWSFDGSRIAYVAPGINGEVQLWIMNSDGSGKKTTSIPGLHPAFSSDGRHLIYQTITSPSDVGVVNVDGTGRRHLTHTTIGGKNRSGGTVIGSGAAMPSPDGKRIVYTSSQSGQNELWTMDADGTNQKQLIFPVDPAAPDTSAAQWSPDGRMIVFFGGFETEYGNVYLMNADGSGRRRLTHAVDVGTTGRSATCDAPQFSADGKSVIFGSSQALDLSGLIDPHVQLRTWIIDLDGGNERVLFPFVINGGARAWTKTNTAGKVPLLRSGNHEGFSGAR